MSCRSFHITPSWQHLVTWFIVLCASAAVGSTGIPAPENVTITSRNFNPHLQWSPVITPEMSGCVSSVCDGVTVTYTVTYLGREPEEDEMTWKNMPNCIKTSKTCCRVTKLKPIITNEFKIYSHRGNETSTETYFEYSPVYDNKAERLHAPNFTIFLNGSDVVVEIPSPPTVLWSPQLLYNYLNGDGLIYTLQYWIKNGSSLDPGEDPSQTDFDANVTSMLVTLQHSSDGACARLKLKGLWFEAAGWTDTVCTPPNPSVISPTEVPSTTADLKFVLVSALIIVVVAIITFLALKFSKRILKNLKKDGDIAIQLFVPVELPAELPLAKTADYDVEHATPFHPKAVQSQQQPHDATMNVSDDDITNEVTTRTITQPNAYTYYVDDVADYVQVVPLLTVNAWQ